MIFVRWILLLAVLFLAACRPDGTAPATSVSQASAGMAGGRLSNDVPLRPAQGTWTAEFATRLVGLWDESERTNPFGHRWDWVANPVPPEVSWQPDQAYPESSTAVLEQPLAEACRSIDRRFPDRDCGRTIGDRLEYSLYRYTLGDRALAAATVRWFQTDRDRLEAFVAQSDGYCGKPLYFDCRRILLGLPLLHALTGRHAEAHRAFGLLDIWYRRVAADGDDGGWRQVYERVRAEAISAVVGGLYVMGQFDDLFAFGRSLSSDPIVREAFARALNAGVARSSDIAGKRALLAAFAGMRRSMGGGAAQQASLELALDCNTAHVAVDAGDGAAARSTFAGLVTRYERLESDLIGEAGFCLWRLAPRVHAQAEQARVAAAMRAKRDANARAVEQAVASDLATLRKDEKETLETNILGPLIIFFAQDRFTAMHVGAPLRNLLNPRPIGPLLIEPERFDQQLIQGLELTKEVPRDRTQYYEQLALLALERHIYFGD